MTKKLIATGHAAPGEPSKVTTATADALADLAIADMDTATMRVLASSSFDVEAGIAAFRAMIATDKAEVVSIRVERLLSISDEDIQAEGAQPIMVDSGGFTPWGEPIEVENYIDPWIERWDAINTKPGTTANDNPWVWCITYKAVKP